jgi:hypothetical protein
VKTRPLARCIRNEQSVRVLPTDVSPDPARPQARTTSTSGAAQAADILALGRAALDVIGRALRSSPEVRANRVMARWPLDLEDLLLELEPMQVETPITELAARLGVSTAQLRSTALRLQRLALVKVSSAGVALTATGRQKLARLEMARAAVLRRIARGLDSSDSDRSKLVIDALGVLIDQAERVVEEQLGQKPKTDRRAPPAPPRPRSNPTGVPGPSIGTQPAPSAHSGSAAPSRPAPSAQTPPDIAAGASGPQSPQSGSA